MVNLTIDFSADIAPIRRLLDAREPGVLAIITGIDGPSYRPLGATMAVFGASDWTGTLSSGCIEADIALHAMAALDSGETVTLRYGAGSPFVDIQLPCGGGLEVTLVPNPSSQCLSDVASRHEARRICALAVDPENSAMSVQEDGQTGWHEGKFVVRFQPEIQFFVFGKGPEAATFSGLVQTSGYPNILLSGDEETLAFGAKAGSRTRHLTSAAFPADLHPDRFSAVVLFFHDHDWEPPILHTALATEAFYVGAQGSRRAAEERRAALRAMGTSEPDIERLRGPIGLILSVRDARKLAVSVLAEILAES